MALHLRSNNGFFFSACYLLSCDKLVETNSVATRIFDSKRTTVITKMSPLSIIKLLLCIFFMTPLAVQSRATTSLQYPSSRRTISRSEWSDEVQRNDDDVDEGIEADGPSNNEESVDDQRQPKKVRQQDSSISTQYQRPASSKYNPKSFDFDNGGDSARVQWMVTQKMRQDLARLRYTSEEIADINPEVAKVIISRGRSR